jgi:hypothetical protein
VQVDADVVQLRDPALVLEEGLELALGGLGLDVGLGVELEDAIAEGGRRGLVGRACVAYWGSKWKKGKSLARSPSMGAASVKKVALPESLEPVGSSKGTEPTMKSWPMSLAWTVVSPVSRIS